MGCLLSYLKILNDYGIAYPKKTYPDMRTQKIEMFKRKKEVTESMKADEYCLEDESDESGSIPLLKFIKARLTGSHQLKVPLLFFSPFCLFLGNLQAEFQSCDVFPHKGSEVCLYKNNDWLFTRK